MSFGSARKQAILKEKETHKDFLFRKKWIFDNTDNFLRLWTRRLGISSNCVYIEIDRNTLYFHWSESEHLEIKEFFESRVARLTDLGFICNLTNSFPEHFHNMNEHIIYQVTNSLIGKLSDEEIEEAKTKANEEYNDQILTGIQKVEINPNYFEVKHEEKE